MRAGRYRPEVLALQRAARNELKSYEDSEWQAHAFAAALLIPRATVREVDLEDIMTVSETYGVSEPFVESYCRRMKRIL